MSGSDACRAWRGSLATRAMGVADPATDPGLDAHLDGCAGCRAELDELRSAAAAVALADPEGLDRRPVPPPLADRIVARVTHEAAAARRRRTGRVLGGVAAAAAVVAVLVTLSLGGGGGDGGGARVALAGGEAPATATLAERAWGTEVTLETGALDEGETYWLWLTDADGDRVGAGTVTGTGQPMTAVFASALPTDEARRIWVTDEDDEVVLDARIPASSP